MTPPPKKKTGKEEIETKISKLCILIKNKNDILQTSYSFAYWILKRNTIVWGTSTVYSYTKKAVKSTIGGYQTTCKN